MLCHCTVFVLNRRKSAVYYSSVHINTHRECGEHLGQCERATERRTDPGRYIADRQCCPHMSKSAVDNPQYNELLMYSNTFRHGDRVGLQLFGLTCTWRDRYRTHSKVVRGTG